MKKKIIILLAIFTLLTPMTTHAEKCLITKGDGTQVGDEIKCGTEEFYVISRKDNVVKMLAKYNLMIGDEINADTFMSEDIEAVKERCQELRNSGEYNDVILTKKTVLLEENKAETDNYFCRTYKSLKYDNVKQNSKAKGLSLKLIYTEKRKILGDEIEYEESIYAIDYPLYGSVYMTLPTKNNHELATNKMWNIIFEKSPFYEYAIEYKKTLNGLNINANDVGILNYEDFADLYEKVTKQSFDKINFDDMAQDGAFIDEEIRGKNELTPEASYDVDLSFSFFKQNIKNDVKQGYEWLYSTSYWLGFMYGYYFEDYSYHIGDLFITEAGDICSRILGCNDPKMGLGYRPVVSINATELVQQLEEPKDEIPTEEEIIENPETGIVETLGYSIMFIIAALFFIKIISKKKLFRRI